jgi:hypothetical protein
MSPEEAVVMGLVVHGGSRKRVALCGDTLWANALVFNVLATISSSSFSSFFLLLSLPLPPSFFCAGD